MNSLGYTQEDLERDLKTFFGQGDKFYMGLGRQRHKTVQTPVECTHNKAQIARDTVRMHEAEMGLPTDCTTDEASSSMVGDGDFVKKGCKLSQEFAETIKVDFIPSIDYRILCRFLGVSSVNEIENHPLSEMPLLAMMMMESVTGFMNSKGFHHVGELNFDSHGNSIPPEKNPWIIKGKETSFTTTGFLYFRSQTGVDTDNVAYFVYTDLERGVSSITCFTNKAERSKLMIHELKEYTKANNCLRGSKLRDINLYAGTFSEIEESPKYTFENYYYSQEMIDLFELEVFGFINNIDKYNKENIYKRGFIIHGKPGTGKTTLGHIICNCLKGYTVVWITPEALSENNYRTFNSIKALYKMADYLSPCVLMLEDLDLLAMDRDRGGDLEGLGALMNVLDGVNSIKNSITIGTTNRLTVIEDALRNRPGRFDRIIEIPPLDNALRGKMMDERLTDWVKENGVMDYIISETQDWTGAEIQEFVNGLNLRYIGEKLEKKILTKEWAKSVIEKMNKYGVGEASGGFGFAKQK